ncbi:2-amino-4-hydroxy-6-hydroxymethyldihydropteridine diphosphokinase [Candidatus Poribacteria bacterium]|nr:2-amino-4-hydroxy-6-hydroxymethyldihydropteridine diphosphokinase [Candidatus Poribacteria bacterium]
MLKTVYLGLGSNLGDRLDNIKQSVSILSDSDKIKILKLSSFFETEPVGYLDQPWFLNCVIKIRTNFSPQELLVFLKNIEKQLKREKKIRFGPRTIDMDILLYGNEILNSKDLIIPHPRLHERKFVLMPLNELAGNVIHPVYRKKIAALLKNMTDKSVVRSIDVKLSS